jgi:hypothetical protein
LAEGRRCARAKRRAVTELRSLDDRMLKDIGVTRGEIRRVAKPGALADCNDDQATDLPLKAHKSAMMQRSHSGFRALHT